MTDRSTSCRISIKEQAITFVVFADEPIPKAIKSLVALFWEIDDDNDDFAKRKLVGITAANNDSPVFRENLIQLLNEQCSDILVMWTGKINEWDTIDDHSLLQALVQMANDPAVLLEMMASKLVDHSLLPDTNRDWRCSRLLQKLQADKLYERLKVFGHNSSKDITNHFLAPMRMLLKANENELAAEMWAEEGNQIIEDFRKDVCEHVQRDPTIYGHLGAMIDYYTSELETQLRSDSDKYKTEDIIGFLEQVMTLLTECRMLTNKKVADNSSSKSSTVKTAPIASQMTPLQEEENPRRILIVDDDVKSWFPILDLLQYELGSQVTIYISSNAVEYGLLTNKLEEDCSLASVTAGWPDFDLVLLDIYLGGKENGLDILEKIRKRIMHLPVVLWTTSNDRELPARAALANGFLFKKTTTIKEMKDLISQWLSIGKSQRLWSLPNPFFDYALRDPKLREVALAFTKWTLRYMDCFHAIDHFYFKFFNDHGGRHILGVLDVTAKLLRPLLFEEGENALFSEEEELRRKQIFCLYIAILCHEFGMFPIYKDEQITTDPKDAEMNWKKVDCFRKLHAVRGMMMLLENPSHVPGQFDVNGCDAHLKNLDTNIGQDGRSVIALLVGYHQRCLDLTSEDIAHYVNIDKFKEANNDVESKFKGAQTIFTDASLKWTNWVNVSDAASSAWKEALDVPLWNTNRIRKLCAILRFADALDVDHTRVPADFILNSNNRRALQDMEDCKRQVLASVSIDQGIVSLEFFAPVPSERILLSCRNVAKIHYECCKKATLEGKEADDFAEISNVYCDDFFKNMPHIVTLNQFINPWLHDSKLDVSSLEMIEELLKYFLLIYFTHRKVECKSCTSDPSEVAGMATLAAILVILEIQDEYNKAVDPIEELKKVIKLGSVRWLGTKILPSIL